ncbi:hypothetical protein B4O97_17070 [Marispirochaeta aestuarii]|uniref:Uncharacterized protein n=1 Tax=Marispirochaeta aestuarii TaxID=1963862 RepID=A0A1Y1RUZ3_9SPIO|nr:hypothetical protein [Marispirochaeta aestuarii]ORC31224.1 hypothetical protein B4O97_17070 [Marispirochaeta aestuarii]
MVSSRLPKRAVLLPRDSYRLVLSVFPGLKKSERLRAVEFRLPELYPGSMEDILWESRLLPGTSGAVLSVLVSRREIEEIRGAQPEAIVYVPLLHCIDRGYPRRGQSLELEYSGSLKDSLIRDTDDNYRLSSLPAETADSVYPEADRNSWKICSPLTAATRIQKSIKGYRGAFSVKQNTRMSLGIRALLTGVAILSGLGIYGERLLIDREAEFTVLSRLTRDENERIETAAALKAEIEALENRLQEAETAAHIDPWLFLNRLVPLMPRGTRIRNLTTRGDAFTLELSSDDSRESALGLGDALSRESGFTDIVFQEVRILQESPEGPYRSRYRLSGCFTPAGRFTTEREDE